MSKKLFLITLFTSICIYGIAQSKMNFSLFEKVQDTKKSLTAPIDVLIKGDVNTIESLVKSVAGTFRYSCGDIVSAIISISDIGKIVSNKTIIRIEAFPPKMHLLSDSMLLNNNVIAVHNGHEPLQQAYTGKDVIIGFIDSGIDLTHPDFKDSLGKTRIKYLWDQTKAIAANTPPAPYNYGQEWNNTQIDNGLASAHNDAAQKGHGTHVAGIAAGNGLATGAYKGVAPEADIIFVAVDFSGTSPYIPAYQVADAAAYIFAKALAMGKPCVINASLGNSMGSHDGQDLESQLIKNLIDQHPGRVFVAAAGNSGNSEFHLGYTVTSDTNFTMFKYNIGKGSAYIQVFADTNNLKNVKFSIGADQMSPVHSFRGRTGFTTISGNIGVIKYDTLYNNGNKIGIIEKYCDIVGGAYSMEFKIYADSTDYNWRLSTTGSGKFDVWSFDMVGTPLPASMKDVVRYKFPDLNKTIESGFQCLDNVITVGNYINRQSYKQYDGSTYFNAGLIPGKRSSTSGIGPTRDGRTKPDIAAPGDMTIAAIESAWKTSLITSNTTTSIAFDGYHVRYSGTSHAAPGVAGIAALYLQQNPTATTAQVKKAITDCAKQDAFTGSDLPNNYWGYGKANGFGALTNCASGIQENNNSQNSLLIYPNPLSNGGVINLVLSNIKPNDQTELKIFNTIGELVKVISINSTSSQVNISLPSGIYFCNFLTNGNTITTEKLVVL